MRPNLLPLKGHLGFQTQRKVWVTEQSCSPRSLLLKPGGGRRRDLRPGNRFDTPRDLNDVNRHLALEMVAYGDGGTDL